MASRGPLFGRHWARRLAWRRARHLCGYLRQLAEFMCLCLSAMADRCCAASAGHWRPSPGSCYSPTRSHAGRRNNVQEPTNAGGAASLRQAGREAAEIGSYHCVSCLG